MKKEHTVDLSCSFCGKHQREVRKLIAGPTVYICDECIKLCNQILGEEAKRAEAAPEPKPAPSQGEGSAKRSDLMLCCSFCGKHQREVRKLIAGPTVYICDECIGLCNDIIAEEIDREEMTEQVSSNLPEATRLLVATVLDRGSSAAEKVYRFTHERHIQILDAIRRRGPELTREQVYRRFLEQSERARPSPKVLAGMSTLAREWNRLRGLVGGGTRDGTAERAGDPAATPDLPPERQPALGEWARFIVERLRFTLEVLDALARRLDEPGFEPSSQSLQMAQEKLDEARDLLMAGPPMPPVD
jgi:hypothetical protein